jgi:enoyl-CoA hydratase/carnithine racemase
MADTTTRPAAVLFREQNTPSGQQLGFAQLNAEKSLHALTLDMIRLLDAQLQRWVDDPKIACVILSSVGERAFCAGGDVRSLRDATLAHGGSLPNPQAEAFFSEEYRLNYRIHTYPKPILLWGGGIVMGGGLGLMAGASHRIVTETSRIAMPEISIGLYPDVGASWFLRRMPGRIGLFLALTGAPLNAHDALELGLADFFLKTTDRNTLFDHLRGLTWEYTAADNHAILSRALREFAGRACELLPPSNVQLHADSIERLMDGDSFAEVTAQLIGYGGDVAWLAKASVSFANGSPTSAGLIWEIWRRALHLGLADVFRMELVVSLQCCAHPDFPEGVRALLVDKDNKPRWTPQTAARVSDQWIADHFTVVGSSWANEANPLADLGLIRRREGVIPA